VFQFKIAIALAGSRTRASCLFLVSLCCNLKLQSAFFELYCLPGVCSLVERWNVQESLSSIKVRFLF
jgi:hypothetical protein